MYILCSTSYSKRKKKKAIKPNNEKLIAISSLLIEAALVDQNFGIDEKKVIENIIKKQFSLDRDYDIDGLITNIVSSLEESGDLVTHTRKIKENWELKDRIEVIEMMWKVCLIDNKIEPYEDMLIRRVAGLIYVSDKDRKNAKVSAIKALNERN